MRPWAIFYLITYVAAIGATWVQQDRPTAAKAAATVLLLAAAAWYWFFGHRFQPEGPPTWRAAGFCVAGVVVFFGGAVAFVGSSAWATPAVISQSFWLLPLRFAAPVAVLTTFAPATLQLTAGDDLGNVLRQLVPAGAIFCALALLMGIHITRVNEQNTRQAELIERLEASRAEVARLSHEAGTAGERERLAREIHDTLAQGFTSIVTLVQAIDSELDSDRDAVRRHLDLAARTARENLGEARAMVAALTPSALASGSLVDAVRRQTDRLSEETGITCGFAAAEELPGLPTVAEVVVLRAAQEALTNVRRHAGAENVFVELSHVDGMVRLTVRDDGSGFDGAEGYGLRGMRARAEQIGGRLSVHSGLSEGTSVRLEVPA